MLCVRFVFNAFRRTAIDHSENTAALLGFRDNNLHRVCRRAENVHYLRNRLDPPQHIDREAVSQGHYEGVSRAQRRRILNGVPLQFFIVPVKTRQAIARRFVERNPELQMRRGVHHRLIDVFDGLDEVTLSHNQVSVLGDRHADGFEFHVGHYSG